MRERILAAALRQMNIYGVKFTTATLARELGISKRALYEHFDSKETLIEAVLDSILDDLRQQITGIVDNEKLDIVDRAKALLVSYPKGFGPVTAQVIMDVIRFMPQQWEKFEEFFTQRWRMLEKVIEDGTNAGVFAPVDLVILKRIYMGTIDQLLDFQFLEQHNMTFNTAMAKAAEIFVGGIMAQGHGHRSARQ